MPARLRQVRGRDIYVKQVKAVGKSPQSLQDEARLIKYLNNLRLSPQLAPYGEYQCKNHGGNGESIGELLMENLPTNLENVLLGKDNNTGVNVTAENAIKWCRSLFNQLHQLHTRAKTVHCDIKPSNLQIISNANKHDTICFIDFGLSSRVDNNNFSCQPVSRDHGGSFYWHPYRALANYDADLRGDTKYLIDLRLEDLWMSLQTALVIILALENTYKRGQNDEIMSTEIPVSWQYTLRPTLESVREEKEGTEGWTWLTEEIVRVKIREFGVITGEGAEKGSIRKSTLLSRSLSNCGAAASQAQLRNLVEFCFGLREKLLMPSNISSIQELQKLSALDRAQRVNVEQVYRWIFAQPFMSTK